MTPAPVPGACLPKTKFTAAFAAHLLYCKFALHLPWERIAGDMASQGYPVAPSTVSDLGLRALDELLPVARVVWKRVSTFPRNHSDATGMPVRTPGKKKVVLGQMFVFGWDKVAAFRYAAVPSDQARLKPMRTRPSSRRSVRPRSSTVAPMHPASATAGPAVAHGATPGTSPRQ